MSSSSPSLFPLLLAQQPATEDPALTDGPLEEPNNTNLPHHYPKLRVLNSPALADSSGVGSWQDQGVHPPALFDVSFWHHESHTSQGARILHQTLETV